MPNVTERAGEMWTELAGMKAPGDLTRSCFGRGGRKPGVTQVEASGGDEEMVRIDRRCDKLPAEGTQKGGQGGEQGEEVGGSWFLSKLEKSETFDS